MSDMWTGVASIDADEAGSMRAEIADRCRIFGECLDAQPWDEPDRMQLALAAFEARTCEVCGRKARETGSEPRCEEHGE